MSSDDPFDHMFGDGNSAPASSEKAPAGEGDQAAEHLDAPHASADHETDGPEPFGAPDFSLPPCRRLPIPYKREMTLFDLLEYLCPDWIDAWQIAYSYDFFRAPHEYARAKATVKTLYPGQLTWAEAADELQRVIERRQKEMKSREWLLRQEIVAELKHALAMGVLDVTGVGPAPDFKVSALSPRLLRDVEIELCSETGIVHVRYKGFQWTSILVVLHRERTQAFSDEHELVVRSEQHRSIGPPSGALAEIGTANSPHRFMERARC